jgi:hypothetical protein
MIHVRFPRPSLAVIFIFSSFGAATHEIRLPGETLSGALSEVGGSLLRCGMLSGKICEDQR